MKYKNATYEYMASILHIRNITEAIANLVFTFIGGVLGHFSVLYLDNINIFKAIFLVVSVDNIFGQAVGLRTKKKENGRLVSAWETQRALKGVWYLFGYSVIVATVLTIQKAFPDASFLTGAVVLPIMLFQLISILKNASLLKILPQGVFLEVMKNIDKYKDQKIQEFISSGEAATITEEEQKNL